MAATILAASALIFVQPVSAQAVHGSDPDNPPPWGSTIITSPSNSGEANPYSFDDPRYYSMPSYDDPALSPAPEQPAENLPGSTFVPPAPVGLVEPFGLPPVNPATSPELILPPMTNRPAAALESPIR
jgi:hypothetical protein